MLCDKALKPDVVFLQETFLDPSSLTSMVHQLHRSGYRMWATQPVQVGGQYRGGAAVMIKAALKARFLESFSASSGQSVAVDMDNVMLASVWHGHETAAESEEFEGWLGELQVQAQALGKQLVLAGDWSCLPSENIFFSLVAVYENETLRPTRWNGTRAIDYALLSGSLRGEASFLEEAFGDRKGIWLTIQGNPSTGTCFTRVPTPKFQKPNSVTLQQWRDSLSAAWNADASDVPQEGVCTSDEEWMWFNQKLERIFQSVDMDHHYSRPKGSRPQVVSAEDTRLAGFRHGCYKERSLRKLLGRVREANRQFFIQGKCSPSLVNSIVRNWPRTLTWTSWAEAEAQVEEALRSVTAESKNNRLTVWKNQIIEQGKVATRWLQGAYGATFAGHFASHWTNG